MIDWNNPRSVADVLEGCGIYAEYLKRFTSWNRVAGPSISADGALDELAHFLARRDHQVPAQFQQVRNRLRAIEKTANERGEFGDIPARWRAAVKKLARTF